jgi:hypothetical protein
VFGSYYSKSEYQEKSFLDKLSGMAAFAGIAALGITVGQPQIQKFTGLIKSSLSKLDPNRVAPLGKRGVGGSVDGLTKEIFSDEIMSKLSLGPLARELQTASITDERINIVLGGLQEKAAEAGQLDAWDLVKNSVKQQLIRPLQAGSLAKARQELSTSSATRDILKATKGLNFNFENEIAFQGYMDDLVQRAMEVQASRKRITAFMSDPENRQSVLNAYKRGIATAKKTDTSTNKIFASDNTRQITFNELIEITGDDKPKLTALGEQVDRHFQEAYGTLKAGEESKKSFILKAYEDFESGVADLLGDRHKKISGQDIIIQANELREEFLSSSTGIFMEDGSGRLFSSAAIRRASISRIESVFNELQIPLFPGFFQAPVKSLFSFTRGDGNFVKRLGALSSQGEFVRTGLLQGLNLSDRSFGFSIGDNILAIDPSNNKIKEIDASFRILSTRLSEHTRKMAEIRGGSYTNAFSEVVDQTESNGLFRGLLNLFKGDPNAPTALRKLLYSNQDYLDITHTVNTVGLKPNLGGLGLGLDSLALKHIYGDPSNVSLAEINPLKLVEFLRASGEELDPRLLSNAVNQVIGQVDNPAIDLGKFLKSASNIYKQYGGDSTSHKILSQLMEVADDPVAMREVLLQNNAFSEELDSVFRLGHSDSLYRALQTIKTDESAFLYRGRSTHNIVERVRQGLLGDDMPSQAVTNLQEALLEELQVSLSVDLMETKYGGSQAFQELRKLVSGKAGEGVLNKNSAYQFFKEELGMNIVDNKKGIQDVLESIISIEAVNVQGKEAYKTLINAKKFRELSLTVNTKNFLGNVNNYDEIVETKARALSLRAYRNLQLSIKDPQQSMPVIDRISGLITDDVVPRALKKTMRGGRGFIPKGDLMTEGTGVEHYLVTSSGVRFTDLFTDPAGALGNLFTKGFGVKDFIQGLVDPNKPLNTASYIATVLGQMPDTLGRPLGLGLRHEDKVTLGRSLVGFYGKRLFPLLVGYEAYKNFNTDAYDSNLPGLDVLGANVVSNINLMTASVKDFLGLTRINKNIVNAVPGLDMYFSPRSKEEYEEYLVYGNEAVRKNRGWVIGSRDPIMGGAVDFYRPNFYRRWKSNWTSADNIDIANSKYSFLPSIRHPFAPFNRLFNPNWFVEKHIQDRPYIAGGVDRPYYVGQFANSLTFTGAGYNTGGFGSGGSGPGGGVGDGSGFGGEGWDVVGGFGAGKSDIMFADNGFGLGKGPSNAGKRVYMSIEKRVSANENRLLAIYDQFTSILDAYRSQTGLYGAFFKAIPGYPQPSPGYNFQDPKYATNLLRPFFMGKYGELGLGPIGEYFRRFTGIPYQDYDAVNDLPNNMPSWLPVQFRTGDPYLRAAGGEYWLPGEAFERLNPWVRPNRLRGSIIGLSEEEMIQHVLDPAGMGEGSAATEYGSRAHLLVQRKLNEAGLLVGAEVPIYDKENNISGTIDAILNGPNGKIVMDIKTQNPEDFAKGITPEKYIDQITFYMGYTGIQEGSLAFVNSDDPNQVRIEKYSFDPIRYKKVMRRVSNVRMTLDKLVAEGAISPYETYDIASRLQVLGRVAPKSREFRDLLEYAEKGGLNTQEKKIIEQVKFEADELSKDYNLYPYRTFRNLDTRVLKILSINADGTITTTKGTVRLAGVKFDTQAFIYEDPKEVLARFGIFEGGVVPVTMLEGNWNEDLMNDTTMPAIIGFANTRLINSDYAEPLEESRHPLDSISIRGNTRPSLGFIERLVHSDTLLTNKFMRVRSGLEQFERGEVYGTDYFSWSDIWGSLIKPSINSFVSQNPVGGALKAGIGASFFVKTPEAKLLVGKWAASIVGALALGRSIKDFIIPNDPWTPRAYDRQTEIDEYYDMLEFMKHTATAEAAKEEAFIREGVNLDLLRNSESRQYANLGPYAMLSIEAEKRAKRTMYGIEAATATLSDVLAAIPDRHRQIAEEIILTGTDKEKKRFYSLLPDHEQRVLGKFLGVKQTFLPKPVDPSVYFKNHYLPDVDWAGWSPQISLDDVRDLAIAAEDSKIERVSRNQVEKARIRSLDTRVPRMDAPTLGLISKRIRALLSTGGLENFDLTVNAIPADNYIVNVRMDAFVDRTNEILSNVRQDIRQA